MQNAGDRCLPSRCRQPLLPARRKFRFDGPVQEIDSLQGQRFQAERLPERFVSQQRVAGRDNQPPTAPDPLHEIGQKDRFVPQDFALRIPNDTGPRRFHAGTRRIGGTELGDSQRFERFKHAPIAVVPGAVGIGAGGRRIGRIDQLEPCANIATPAKARTKIMMVRAESMSHPGRGTDYAISLAATLIVGRVALAETVPLGVDRLDHLAMCPRWTRPNSGSDTPDW